MKTYSLAIMFLFLGLSQVQGQETKEGKSAIIAFLAEKDYRKADSALQAQIQFHKKTANLDSLAGFPYYIGKVALHLGNPKKAIAKVENFIAELEQKGATHRNLYDAFISFMYFLDEIGEAQKSYDITARALAQAKKMPGKNPVQVGNAQYNLGASALSLGNFDLAKKHFKESFKTYSSSPETPDQKLADIQNAMGAVMWNSTKLDSARYYYNKSLETIRKSDIDSLGKSYLSAITLSNIALIQQSQGNTSQAIESLQKTISNYQKVILHGKDGPQKKKAVLYRWGSICNLAVFYNDIGDFSTANALLDYVYQKQREKLLPSDAELYKTEIKIAQSLMSLKEYERALETFAKAMGKIQAADESPFWKAVAFFGMAQASEELGKPSEALCYYRKSGVYFKANSKNAYNADYMDFLEKKSLFLAKNAFPEKAVETATVAYEYIVGSVGKDNFLAFEPLLNLAKINYELKSYENALRFAEKSLKLLDGQGSSGTLLDSIQLGFQKPRAILVAVKSEYQLSPKKDSVFLAGLYQRLKASVSILEKRKSAISSQNLPILIENNSELFGYLKKIGLELYQKTENPQYLKEVVAYHESALYNKIRARFNLRNDIGFAGVPEGIIAKGTKLKQNIARSLQTGTNRENGFSSFFEAREKWRSFLKDLKKSYPGYYKMRYATLSVDIAPIQKNLKQNTSVVRYFFVGKDLYAVLLTKSKFRLYHLGKTGAKDKITRLRQHQKASREYGLLHELYQKLWAPLAEDVDTKNLIIIPDGVLFNLSFETLTSLPSKDPASFLKNSLLAKHAISYNFSLLMLSEPRPTKFKGQYVAFAPGFSSQMKSAYQKRGTGFPGNDNTYLSLIPQPFTIDLINDLKKRFQNGEAFLAGNSTISNFKKNAGISKILHIGTHAETNNLNPSLSRLIFAKDFGPRHAEDPGEAQKITGQNSLYAYQIYDLDLFSKLTVLAACETGKPEYSPGEGMISLAHAFHYAGSQSMLTSLWNIDEQASATIIGSFFEYLSKGYDKPEALRQAKLDYLQHAVGRTASPRYWAGLVVMGNPSSIDLDEKNPDWYWIAGIAGLLLFSLFLGYKRWS